MGGFASARDISACLLNSTELDPDPSTELVSVAGDWLLGSAIPVAKGSFGPIEASMEGARDVLTGSRGGKKPSDPSFGGLLGESGLSLQHEDHHQRIQ